MSSVIRCDTPIQGLVLRIIKLNACGVPITGDAGGVVVIESFIQVQDSPQYDTGDRKIQRTAAGKLCQNKKMPDEYTNDELTVDFCAWNPGIVPITLGGRLLSATESPTGTGFALGTWADITEAHWSLEVWQAPGDACDDQGNVYWPYHAWPHLSDGKRGQMTISEDPTLLQIIANTFNASPLWTAGATWLGTGQVIYGDHYLRNLSNTAPPPEACAVSNYTAP